MDKCKHCDEPLKHVDGRKKKSFCNVNCKNKYFYAQRSALIKKAMEVTVNNLNEGTQNVQNLNETKISNYTVNTIPKTLDELKAMCPKEYTGFDRSLWISEKRKEYGI